MQYIQLTLFSAEGCEVGVSFCIAVASGACIGGCGYSLWDCLLH